MTRGRERLPVIMLSADATPEAKQEALEAGADAFLAKPIEAMRLLDEIQRSPARGGGAGARGRPPSAVRGNAFSGGAGRGQRRDPRAPRGARLLARLRREADPRVPRRQRRDHGAHRESARGARLSRVPLAGACDEGLFGEHGHRPPDAPVPAWRACRTPSCACRRRRCCARSARSSPRRAQLERYLQERRKSAVSHSG